MARRSSIARYASAASSRGEGEVEDLAGVDLAIPDECDQLLAGQLHVVGDADIADVPAGGAQDGSTHDGHSP